MAGTGFIISVPMLVFLVLLTTLSSTHGTTSSTATSSSTHSTILRLRGGKAPQGNDNSASDYYDKFELDYGKKDKVRVAGAIRGFLPAGKISDLPESDPFLKWLNEHMETGPTPIEGRLKPFYVSLVVRD